jgi:hypothetical protein
MDLCGAHCQELDQCLCVPEGVGDHPPIPQRDAGIELPVDFRDEQWRVGHCRAVKGSQLPKRDRVF